MRKSVYSGHQFLMHGKTSTLTFYDWSPYLIFINGSGELVGRTLPDSSIPYPGEVSFNAKSLSTTINVDVNAFSLDTYDTHVSYASPGWNDLAFRKIVSYKGKKLNLTSYLREPTAPVFRLPRFSLPSKPKAPGTFVPNGKSVKALKFAEKVNLKRILKFRKRMAKYDSLVKRKRLIEDLYRKRFLLRMAKYKKAKASYDLRVKKLNARKPRVVRFRRRWNLIDNPHLKLSLRRLDEGISFVSYYYDTVGTTSPHVLNMISYPYSSTGIEDQAFYDKVADDVKSAFMFATSDLRAEMDSKLTSKFYEKLSRQKIHYGNMLAERAQTYDLLRSSVTRLYKLITLKRNVFKSLGRFLLKPKMIANDYLAFQFGVKPLLDDIFNSIELLAEATVEGDEDQLVIRTNVKRFVDITTADLLIQGRIERSYVFKYTVENPYASDANSLGLLNPSEIAWEVLPWSFVVDWFLPVGTYLSSLSSDVGLNFLTGTIGERFIGTIKLNPAVTSPALHDGSQRLLPSGTFALKYNERNLANPPDKFGILRTKSPLSWTHGFESLALLVQKALK